MMLWLSSFVATGHLEDETAAAGLFAHATTILIPFAVAAILLTGWVADRVQPAYTIPTAFALRAFVCSQFQNVSDPHSALSYALITALVVTSAMLVINIEGYFIKGLPKEVRGSMTLVLTFFCGLNSTLFNYVGGPIFDSIGPAAPFTLTAGFDWVFCLFGAGLAYAGYLRRQEPSSSLPPSNPPPSNSDG